MEVSVVGKVAVVTGASRGIGLETARVLATSGAEGVVITSRKPETIEAAADDLIDSGIPADRVLAVAARADSDDAADETMVRAIERFGAVDILVNNAGTNPSGGPIMSVDMGAIDKTWAVNQRAPLVWSRAAYRHWMETNGGAIVNVASVGGIRPVSRRLQRVESRIDPSDPPTGLRAGAEDQGERRCSGRRQDEAVGDAVVGRRAGRRIHPSARHAG